MKMKDGNSLDIQMIGTERKIRLTKDLYYRTQHHEALSLPKLYAHKPKTTLVILGLLLLVTLTQCKSSPAGTHVGGIL